MGWFPEMPLIMIRVNRARPPAPPSGSSLLLPGSRGRSASWARRATNPVAGPTSRDRGAAEERSERTYACVSEHRKPSGAWLGDNVLVSRHAEESPVRHVWPPVLVGRGTRRDGAILQVSGCTGQDRARRQGSSPVELEPGDRAADLAPITLLDSGCRVLIGVRCPSGDRTRSTKPRKVAKLSARAGILRVRWLTITEPALGGRRVGRRHTTRGPPRR